MSWLRLKIRKVLHKALKNYRLIILNEKVVIEAIREMGMENFQLVLDWLKKYGALDDALSQLAIEHADEIKSPQTHNKDYVGALVFQLDDIKGLTLFFSETEPNSFISLVELCKALKRKPDELNALQFSWADSFLSI